MTGGRSADPSRKLMQRGHASGKGMASPKGPEFAIGALALGAFLSAQLDDASCAKVGKMRIRGLG
eukprot:CAMPEP_0177397718 /NCGR_PEP_ID=MMETSP0368-20130122/57482_1 /TAXON_ID=447022 ORGANISM="Scrippsiella hangoei-like, Strain SHHI-4" /NCGR_SAMPLE_ID=MMETSP0368 /ASSEMBLY_ACC=CAM_ASM_000363 /LENGTH=64 /DNA_ID=CAMNT_0018864683 /DNA_START=119 /DNA_END=309 /DNA_ORIENTATION=-